MWFPSTLHVKKKRTEQLGGDTQRQEGHTHDTRGSKFTGVQKLDVVSEKLARELTERLKFHQAPISRIA